MEEIIAGDPVFQGLDDNIKRHLVGIAPNNTKFKEWFLANIDKIRGKIRPLRNNEDILDVIAELRTAAKIWTSDDVNEVIYEPLGTETRCPDFKISLDNGESLYIEVKRVRRTPTEARRDDFIELFKDEIKRIELNFGVSMFCHELVIPGYDEIQIYEELINRMEEIIGSIREILVQLNEDDGKFTTFFLSDYANNLRVDICTIPYENRNNRIHYYGGLENNPMTGRELYKFGDIICEKIPQLLANENNIIFIVIDNDSHEYEDLLDGVASINQLITERDDTFFANKGLISAEHFLNESRKLSAVFVLSRPGRGKLWENQASNPRLTGAKLMVLNDICN
ncbi:MAG: hypothetical protein PHT78_08340 [Desulfitobacteriaceae bacterium]|nr:hypothetical protein [Desulfitobacteriaceae bacterium]